MDFKGSFLTIVLGLWAIMSLAQQGENPFEVRPVPKPVIETVQPDSSGTTISQGQGNIFEVRSTESTKQSSVNVDQLQLEKNNPFEVNHIPIRKERKRKARSNLSDGSSNVSSGFLFWVMLFASIIFAVLFSQNYQNITKIWKSILNNNLLKQSMRTENAGLSLLFLCLYLLFVVNLAVLVYKALEWQSTVTGFSMWTIFVAGIAVIYILRHFFYAVLGFVFPIEKEMSQYSYTTGVFNVFIGLVLLPINLFVVFGPSSLSKILISGGLLLILCMYMFRLLRGSFIFSGFMNSNKFHFFIYLCSCEIAPLLILYRFLIR